MGSNLTGSKWTASDVPSGNSDTLTINPFAGSATNTGNSASRTITVAGTVTQTGFITATDTITPTISGLNSLDLTKGSVTYQVTIDGTKTYPAKGGPSNMFSGIGPSTAITGTPKTLTSNGFIINTTYDISVTFSFAKNSVWSVPSSPITVVFNGT